MEAADVVVMNDDRPHCRDSATVLFHHAVLWQNISLALGIRGMVFLVLAVFGNATMWMAVFADMGANFLVVLKLPCPARPRKA